LRRPGGRTDVAALAVCVFTTAAVDDTMSYDADMRGGVERVVVVLRLSMAWCGGRKEPRKTTTSTTRDGTEGGREGGRMFVGRMVVVKSGAPAKLLILVINNL